MARLPTSQQEFEELMEEIDAELRRDEVPIHARSFHAIRAFAIKCQVDLPIPAASTCGIRGIYAGESGAAHIIAWFDHRYGDRQNIFMGPGSTIVLLRGDPWEVRLPLIFGRVHCVVARELNRRNTGPIRGLSGEPPVINLLDLIVDLPAGLAKSLSDQECELVYSCFMRGMHSLNVLQNFRSKPYVPEALADIDAAVRHLLSNPPHYGQSKWASAQAAEKLLKSFLKDRGRSFPYSHDIHKLSNLAQAAGFPITDLAMLDQLQTSPASRYGEEQVSLSQAANAHAASLYVGQLVGEAALSAN
jgi:HEPN domain-containing protein